MVWSFFSWLSIFFLPSAKKKYQPRKKTPDHIFFRNVSLSDRKKIYQPKRIYQPTETRLSLYYFAVFWMFFQNKENLLGCFFVLYTDVQNTKLVFFGIFFTFFLCVFYFRRFFFLLFFGFFF